MASDSLKIGRIWGINVNLHWTFVMLLLLFLLFYPLKIFAVFLLLFVCVFVHESAHAYTALRNKLKVKEIILTPLGGATTIDTLNIDYRREFNVSISGPIMSIFLGGLFGIAAALSPPGTLVFILQEMFILNIALGVLNIIPAFPLDGGRVFRSYLEKKHNPFDATMITVKVSKLLAVFCVMGSILYLYLLNVSLSYKILDFVIFMIVAAVIYGGASAEEQITLLKRDTKGLTIDKAVKKEFMIVAPSAASKDLYALVEKKGVSMVLTKINGEFMLLDIFGRGNKLASHASDLAIRVPQLRSGLGVIDALQQLEGSGRGIGVVVRNGKAMGTISVQNINALLSLHLLRKRGAQAS